MDKLNKRNAAITSEANKILYDYRLLAILEKYGNPVPTGSYMLGLMTWRDLDIHLETNEMTEVGFFELGQDIALCLKPHRMHYRNEFVGKTPDLPTGYYWGIYTNVLRTNELWKIDIWSIGSEQMELNQKEFNDLRPRINAANRAAILTGKHHFCQHPEYRKAFTSMDIYHAVTERGVKTVEEFSQWLQENKGIE